jgi:hypothetical protein
VKCFLPLKATLSKGFGAIRQDTLDLNVCEKKSRRLAIGSKMTRIWYKCVGPKNPTSGDWLIQEETSAAQQPMANQDQETREPSQRSRT